MGKYIIAGGSGFVGRHLTALLEKEQHDVFILTTQKGKAGTSVSDSVKFIYWNPVERMIDKSFQLSNCRIINLAGANIAGERWTPSRKKEIVESRTSSLETLYAAVEKKQIQPVHLLSSSAIGYYGESDKILTEEDHGDESFLSSTCRQWEEVAWRFARLNLPVSVARFGIVLGKDGGALKEFAKPLHFGLAAIPSDGKQIYSWIHVDDLSRLLFFLSSNNKEGIFNAVSPRPASVNQIFFELIKHTHPFFLKVHVPDFTLRMVLGEMATEVLKSVSVSSHKIEDQGFAFAYPGIDQCIAALMEEG